MGSDGYVQAWEPVWGDALTLNIHLNGLPVVVVGNAMASGHARLLQKLRPKKTWFFNAGDIKIVPYDGVPSHGQAMVMTGSPAASVYDFIKIDVEGAEADVWQALTGVRELSPNLTVCMEFTPGAHTDPMAFVELLMNDGFVMGTVGHDGVPRACSLDEALVPDTGEFRMLWLTRGPS